MLGWREKNKEKSRRFQQQSTHGEKDIEQNTLKIRRMRRIYGMIIV
jgi:hypothetical protein